MELPRNSGSSVWSGKCGWGISSDLFPLLSPLVGHARAILLPRYTTESCYTKQEGQSCNDPSQCTRYTNSVTHSVTHPQASTSWTHEAQHASPRRTNSHNISRLDAGGRWPACGDRGARRHGHLPRPGDSPPVLVREPCRPSWTCFGPKVVAQGRRSISRPP